ncbi:MAG: serine protease, partial [Pirellulaceae bacterium]
MPLLVPSNRCLLIRSWKVHLVTLLVLGIPSAARLPAQAVCLPAPRLLTTVPMGGQVGTEVEVTITGENLEDVTELHFSDPRITARPVADSSGARFIVAIAPQTPRGLYEARVMCRLGLSTSRVFHVSDLPETIRRQPNTSVESAMDLALNTVCNASVTPRAIDYYRFDARQGQRIVVDCAARGIESKLTPVVILADARGNDLVVERRGGLLSFAVPADGKYLVKIHDLTFQGGETHFYRLVVHDIGAEAPLPSRIPSTQTVSAFSWPPVGLAPEAARTEPTPDPGAGDVQTVTLPCDVAGSFFPAADVDTFEFTAKKGEVWWIEVASQRLGRPTDPFAVVQQVRGDGEAATVTDVAEFSDIASPIKPSSNFYSYDGPPYDGGSPDILGRLEIKEDGKYRLQLRDLFGATRNDPQNVYRLVIRQAAPDFALAAWALHMELRNGDRNDLSKPLSLRGGATMPLEVVA